MASSQFHFCKKTLIVVILCGTNNIHLDAPEYIADDITKIWSTLKRVYSHNNVSICGILPHDHNWSINQVWNKKIEIKNWNFKIKVCPVLIQLYGSRHLLHQIPKSITFLFWQNLSSKIGELKIIQIYTQKYWELL